ncbi:hypothetical protein G4X40_20180 [Rhodococcus sp. D2-41]|uniref:Gp19/Gp15/Gp42 family protein n=1 Tax=Speluncibacter jeojiensis TaxID=2710754 RepID=UPI00240FE56C|nr:Gp19/Gp15/Gp42 family protein [Rhodococcus sp. D2-41]MDG3012461.1 hypothetical protein [Rhodococcus sp. D2-41]
MSQSFATTDDLQKRWRGYNPADGQVAEELLVDAALWLSAWFPGAAAAAETNPELAQALLMVSCSMVKRALLNGDTEGQASNSETVGPFAYQVAYRNPDGNLYILAAERDLLARLLGLSAGGAVSMNAPGGL